MQPDALERRIAEALEDAGLDSAALVHYLRALPDKSAVEVWRFISQRMLQPTTDFDVHRRLAALVFEGWPVGTAGPAPLWSPSADNLADSNIARFLHSFKGDEEFEAARQAVGRCDARQVWPLLQQLSWRHPDAFWLPVLLDALQVQFATRPTSAMSRRDGTSPDTWRWLPGARLNIAAAALHSPLAASPTMPAIVWAGEGAPSRLHTVTLQELQRTAGHIAACLRTRFQTGDAIAINLPMTALGTAAYLGVVLAGCVVVSIPDSFSSHEIRTRLKIAHAKGVITQDVVQRGGKSLPLFARVAEADTTLTVLVMPAIIGGQLQVKLRSTDVAWDDFLGWAPPSATRDAHIADAYDNTNILFSSGTTGEPKAIVWTHLTPLRAATDAWSLLDVRRGDVLCWPTNLGWMMGPWLIYAALLNGATMALYQGSPLGRDFGEFVSSARVTMLGVVPSIVRAWRAADCMQGVDWTHLSCFASTGEASAPDDQHWLMAQARYRPVIEYCGGTEIGGAFIAGCMLQPQVPAAFSTPTLGCRLVLLPEQAGPDAATATKANGAVPTCSPQCIDIVAGRTAAAAGGAGEAVSCSGELALVPPTWGGSQSLLNKDHFEVYYAGMPMHPSTSRPLRRHGDVFQRLPGNYFMALGRCDDTMNLGGIKVSSIELERVVMESVPGISEAAAVGVPTPGGGPEHLYLFVVLQSGQASSSSGGSGTEAKGGRTGATAAVDGDDLLRLRQRCNEAIRTRLNPLFKVEHVVLKVGLPRTASNKIMRRVLRDGLPKHSRM